MTPEHAAAPRRPWYKSSVLWVLPALLIIGGACQGGDTDRKGKPLGDKTTSAAPYHGPNTLPHCTSNRPKDCYTQQQMEAYANRIYNAVRDIEFAPISKQMSNPASMPKMVFVHKGDRIKTWCIWSNDTSKEKFYVPYNKALSYCTGADGQFVYIGEGLIWEFYQMGELVPALVIAHELTHHLQSWSNVKTPGIIPQPTDTALILKAEDQADCMSGDFVTKANQVLKAANMPIISSKMVGKYAHWLNAHNKTRPYKPGERNEAIDYGEKNGANACAERYFPDRSIVKGP